LKQFEGTLVFISHDVYFIKALANKVLHVADGVLTPYLGDYEFYLHKTKAASARAALTAGGAGGKAGAVKGGAKSPAAKATPALAAPAKPTGAKPVLDERERQRQIKKLQQIVQKLEQEIEALEAEKAPLAAALEQPDIWQDARRAEAAQRDFAAVEARLAAVTTDWERQAEALQQLHNA
jgi:ATP-binding cassette, subfamily F, member 3